MIADSARFARFVAAGVVNTAASYAIYLALLPFVDYQLAYAIAYVAGIATQYVLHSRFVFAQPMSWRGLAGYPVIHLALYAVGVVLLRLLVDGAGLSPRIAPLVVIAVNLPLGFVLTRAWLAHVAARATLPPPTRADRVEGIVALAIVAIALVFVLGAANYLLVYGWRQPMADQLRQYLPLLEMPFPMSVLVLENGHRPVAPNLLRAIDLAWGGNQVLLIVSGLVFALGTVGGIAWAAWRDARLTPTLRAAALLFAGVGVMWLGNARMLLHGNESAQVYLAALAVVASALFAVHAVTRASIAAMLAATACCLVATFSFGSGIAAFPALIVLALAMRAPRRLVLVPAIGLVVALVLYMGLLPGDGGVREAVVIRPIENASIASRWLAGPWLNAWLSLTHPPGGDWLVEAVRTRPFGGALVATATGLDAAIGRDGIERGLAFAIGFIGALLMLALLAHRAWRREAWSPLAACGAALGLFGGATAALVSLVRHDYFLAHPTQLFAERYGVWPCLFWCGLALMLVDLVANRRALARGMVAALAVAIAMIAWPTHLAWRGWGAAVDARAEAFAASVRFGVYDASVQPAHDEVNLDVLIRVVDELRARDTTMFADPAFRLVGTTVAASPAVQQDADVVARRRFDDPATNRAVLAFDGALRDRRLNAERQSLVVLDRDDRVVGLANWTGNPDQPADAWLLSRRRSGITGYAFVQPDCAPLRLATRTRASDEPFRVIAPLTGCVPPAP